MADYQWRDSSEGAYQEDEEAFATYEFANAKTGEGNLTALQMTTKIAPAYDGKTSWFAYKRQLGIGWMSAL